MRSFILVGALATVALAQSSSITAAPSYSNPNTAFTTQTDSNGVITGQPEVNTSVGAAETDVGAAETSIAPLPSGDSSVNLVPAGLPTGIQTVTIGNGTITASINNSTTIVLSSHSSTQTTPRSGAANPTGGSGGSGSGSESGTGSSISPTSTAGAAHFTAVGALAGAAGFVAAFL